MQSQASKILFSVILTAVIVGGGVYFWQHQEAAQITTPVATVKDSEQLNIKPVTQESTSTDLFELAKNTKDEFTYLVSAPKLTGDWKMTINNNSGDYVLRFSLKYKYSPWGELRYTKADLTATDGAPPVNGLSGVASYSFCAGQYYCDETNHKGMGFDLTFWNAKFIGRSADPKFYLKDGETFLKETDKYIVTYKPFTGSTANQQVKVDQEVSDLVSSFEIY